MARTKWLALSFDKSLSDIATLLDRHKFSKDQIIGFELTNIQRNKVCGKFIEKIITTEVVIDPFGEEILNHVQRYSIFNFEISPMEKYRFLVRIDTPPRSLKNFITTLSDSFGFGFAIEPLEIDILSMIQHLRKESGIKRWSIRKIRIARVAISEASLARIEVVSTKDAYLDLKNNIAIKDATLERATIELRNEENIHEIELTSSGIISGDLDILDRLMPALQTYFR